MPTSMVAPQLQGIVGIAHIVEMPTSLDVGSKVKAIKELRDTHRKYSETGKEQEQRISSKKL